MFSIQDLIKSIRNSFLRGLITFLPIVIAIYVVFSCIRFMEDLLGNLLRAVMPQYPTGLGFVLTILIIFFFGLSLNNLITQSLLKKIEKMLTEIPFFKSVYLPLRDLMNLFSKSGDGKMKSVVMVQIGTDGFKALGVVTRDNFSDIPPVENETKGLIAVFIPLSYSVGGITLLVPKTHVTDINISIEKAMSLGITGWVQSDKNSAKGKLNNEV